MPSQSKSPPFLIVPLFFHWESQAATKRASHRFTKEPLAKGKQMMGHQGPSLWLSFENFHRCNNTKREELSVNLPCQSKRYRWGLPYESASLESRLQELSTPILTITCNSRHLRWQLLKKNPDLYSPTEVLILGFCAWPRTDQSTLVRFCHGETFQKKETPCSRIVRWSVPLLPDNRIALTIQQSLGKTCVQ